MKEYNDQEIVQLYDSGLSIRKIADKTSVSNTQVRRILKRNNVQSRSTKTPKETDEQTCVCSQNTHVCIRNSQK